MATKRSKLMSKTNVVQKPVPTLFETGNPSRIGYARVSTGDQDEQLQVDALERAGCGSVYTDHGVSGSTSSRPAWDACLNSLRRGDALVVWRLDRAGRSTRHLLEVSADLESRGIEFVSLRESIDTSTATGRFFFTVMAGMAEMERELIRERTNAGLAAARSQGRVGGRPVTALTKEKVNAARGLRDSGRNITQIALALGISRASVYRALQKL